MPHLSASSVTGEGSLGTLSSECDIVAVRPGVAYITLLTRNWRRTTKARDGMRCEATVLCLSRPKLLRLCMHGTIRSFAKLESRPPQVHRPLKPFDAGTYRWTGIVPASGAKSSFQSSLPARLRNALQRCSSTAMRPCVLPVSAKRSVTGEGERHMQPVDYDSSMTLVPVCAMVRSRCSISMTVRVPPCISQ